MFNEQEVPYPWSDLDKTTPHHVRMSLNAPLVSSDLAKPLWGKKEKESKVFSKVWYNTQMPDVRTDSLNKCYFQLEGWGLFEGGGGGLQTPVTVT